MGFPCSIGISGITELHYQVRARLWRTCAWLAAHSSAGSVWAVQHQVCWVLGAFLVSPEPPHFSLSSDSSAVEGKSQCIGWVLYVCAVLNWNEHFPWSPELWEVHVEAVALCKVCVCMAGINIPINIPTWSWAGPAGVILGHHGLTFSNLFVAENRRLCMVPVWLPGASLSLGLPSAKATLKFLYQRLPSAGVFAFISNSAGSLYPC